MNRAALYRHMPPIEGHRGFEIGGLTSPFHQKGPHSPLLVDHLPTEGLRAKYANDPVIDVDQIAEVDVVVGDDGLYAALAPHGGESGFDYAIASNIIEHTPDMIGWLGDIARLVHPGGRLLLVVPDKRYTFDYLRRLSSLTDLMDAWIRGNSKPSPARVFDFSRHAVKLDAPTAWAGRIDPAKLEHYCVPKEALEFAANAYRNNTYHDSHCWVFTATSFLGLCIEIAKLGLMPWKLVHFGETPPNDFEFGLILKRTSGTEDVRDIIGSFRRAHDKMTGTELPSPLDEKIVTLEDEVARLRTELRIVRQSTSWRMTALMRTMGKLLYGPRGRSTR